MTHKSVYMWDVTLKFETYADREQLTKDIKSLAKSWCFQLEKGGENGYLHWQIRFSLFKRKRENELVNILRHDIGWPDFRAKPTSNEGRKSLYCMKLDTRVEGPWSDKDKEPKYIQRRFRDANLRDWQERLRDKLVDMKNEGNDRNIILVKDDGNEGKSFFKGYLYSHRDDVVMIPSTFDNANSMIQFMCSNKLVTEGWDGIVVIDVPRATSKKHWWTLAAGLETLKQGFLHDERYHGSFKTIEPPQMACFMNEYPPDGVMTSDVFIRFNKAGCGDLIDEPAAGQEEQEEEEAMEEDCAAAAASAD